MIQAVIFQPEINTLESQAAALQEQLRAAQQRIDLLGKVEFLLDGSIQALVGAATEAIELVPDVRDRIQEVIQDAVAKVFGKQGIEAVTEPVAESVAELEPESEPQPELELKPSLVEPQARTIELVGDFILADASDEEEEAEAEVETTSIPQNDTYVELVPVADAIAYLRKQQDGEILAAYIGFKSRTRAEKWGQWLVKNGIAAGFESRGGERMANWKHELKLWGVTVNGIQGLKALDFTGVPDAESVDIWSNAAIYEAVVSSTETEEEVNYSTSKQEPELPEEESTKVFLGEEIKSSTKIPQHVTIDTQTRLDLLSRKSSQGVIAASVEQVVEQVENMASHSEVLNVGDEVEVVSDRHGAELVGKVGKVTAATNVGCAVKFDSGVLRWFCLDEVIAFVF